MNPHVSLKHLTSKLLAGGLTAGIVLIWWPTHYSTTGLEALVARGIVATLGFELMMLAFAGVEDRIVARIARRSTRFDRLRERAAATPRRARTGFVLAAGGVALVVPVLALASAGSPRVPAAHAAAHAPVVQPVRERVVRQVVVKRRVIHDEVVVAAPSNRTAGPTTTTRTTSTAAPKPSTAKATPKHAPGRQVAQTKADKPVTTPQTTTTTAPAPSATTAPTTTTPAPTPPPADADAATAAAEPGAS
jgi:hypothetical protein